MTQPLRRLAAGLAVALLCAFAQAGPKVAPAGVDRIVSKIVQDWNQPGLAVAIVSDGHIAYEKGFGVRKLGSPDPVDAHTMFGIASVSKGFASATVAKLVADGRADWDDPVTRHLPWFRMPREADSDQVTLRDLLSMRAGLGSSEYTFRRASANRADHVRRIRFLPQVHPMRAEYAYTTDTYTAIGEVVATITGGPWEQFAASTLWQPIGMTRTNADHRVARSDANAASPHLTVEGSKRPIEWIYEDYNALPAGGVNSTAHDLASWLLFQLNDDAFNGALCETRMPQAVQRGADADSTWAEVAGTGTERLRYRSYAMGWFSHDYRGHEVLWHSGSIDGFRSFVGLLPGEKVGVIVLSNSDEGPLPTAVFQTLVDSMLGLGTRAQWSERFRKHALADRAGEAAKRNAMERSRVTGTRASAPLDRYAGRYTDNGAFGDVEVRVEGGKLVIEAGRMHYDLEHWHYDIFKARPRWPYEMERRNFFVDFRLDPLATVEGFHFSTGSEFTRKQ